MNEKLLNQLISHPDFGTLFKKLEQENTPPASDTSSKSLTSKKFAARDYPHTPEQIAQELRVDEQGQLWWLKSRRGRFLNKPVGSPGKNGYWQTSLDGGRYLNHTLAWCLYYGRWPTPGMVLDHIDHIKHNNRKENLREVSHATNIRNRKGVNTNNVSGVAGVFWNSACNKWKATLGFLGKNINGGDYLNFESAVAARRALEIEYSLLEESTKHDTYLKGISL